MVSFSAVLQENEKIKFTKNGIFCDFDDLNFLNFLDLVYVFLLTFGI